MGIVERVSAWFERSWSTGVAPEAHREVPCVPPAPEDARPQPGAMAVQPLRCSTGARFLG